LPDELSNRIPEPELMDGHEQARAYAEADFQQPHDMFVQAFRERLGTPESGTYLDLGCGTADISCRFAKTFPETKIHGIDGSAAMLGFARGIVDSRGLSSRISLFNMRIPTKHLPKKGYHGVIVNSLLHHLPDPSALWKTIKQAAGPGAPVFIMDLLRPRTKADARSIVETYSGNEPEILKRDFYNSLLAAYRPEEIKSQLEREGMDFLRVEVISDRHFLVWGYYE